MKVLHVITGLATGGAEMMLLKVISGMDRSRFDTEVLSLMDRGTLGDRIETTGSTVHTLRMSRPASAATASARFVSLLRRSRPDVVQGWLPHGNLFASLSRVALGGAVPVLWNVRQSLYSVSFESRTTQMAIRAGAALSFVPTRIIYNSRKGADQHEAIGYRADRRELIPNGFDCEVFAPDARARAAIRTELGVPEGAPVIGMIGRYHPMKGHDVFLQAARKLAEVHPSVHFVLAGLGVHRASPELHHACEDPVLGSRLHLLGERRDTPSLNAAFDIASLTSVWGEGFPNVIGEAMACGVPCVAADIGDSRWIIDDYGAVVPPSDPAALAQAWRCILALPAQKRAMMGEGARARIVEHFSLMRIVHQYEALYTRVYGAGRA